MAEQTTKVVTGKVRFSYTHVFQAHAMSDNEQAKYSCAILVDKNDTKTLNKIASAVEAAKQKGKHEKYGGKIPATLKLPLRDGDEERPDDEAYAGKMFFNASSNSQPAVVDKELNPILDADEFYSGCFGRVSVNFYPYNSNGSKGVAAGLNNIQKLEDGERLSGGSTAEEDFGEPFEDDDLI